MKIGIRWPKGTIRLEIEPNDGVKLLLKKISEKIQIEAKYLVLYHDEKLTDLIDISGSCMRAHIENGSFIFLKVNSVLPEVPVATMTAPVDAQEEYLDSAKEIPANLKRIRQDYGTKTITPAFLEYKESLKPSITEQDDSSCFAIRIGEEPLKLFQKEAVKSAFLTHRLAFLFGRINKISGKITVHCFLEPHQINQSDRVTLTEEFDPTICLAIARQFKMSLVGMAISHRPVNEKYPMTEYMIKMAAMYQNMFGEYFTTLIVMPTKEGSIEVDAFQVIDSAMKLESFDLFAESEDQTHILFKEPVKVLQKKLTKIDCNLLLCAVRIRQTKSRFLSHSFPHPSTNPSIVNLNQYITDNLYSPPWYAMFDFNLLYFCVARQLIPLEEMLLVVDLIVLKEDIPFYAVLKRK